MILLKLLSCSSVQYNDSVAQPLVVSYGGLAISVNPGI